jgi:hypothetical protein
MNRGLPRRKWTLVIVLIFALAHCLSTRTLRAEECDRIKLSLRLSEPAFPLHAPVFATMEILNEGTLPVSIDLGKNSKGNLRLVFNLPDGRTINALPYKLPPDGVFVPGAVVLRPGATYTQQLLLNEWQEFALVGKYRVLVRIEQSPGSCIGEGLSAVTGIEILPRDEPRLTKICNELATAAVSLNAASATTAAEGLSFTGDEACLGALVRVLKGDARGRSWALTGLARIGTKEAVAAVAGEWHRFDEFDQAEALTVFTTNGKSQALLAAVADDKPKHSKPR